MSALQGIRVIDLTRILAGPFCTMLLADMGADVVKIESAAGDPVRGQGVMVDGYSGYFEQFNRNKRSVVLDLYSDEGKAHLTRLLRDADVVVENLRSDVKSNESTSNKVNVTDVHMTVVGNYPSIASFFDALDQVNGLIRPTTLQLAPIQTGGDQQAKARRKLLTEYGQVYKELTPEVADSLAARILALDNDRIELHRKYLDLLAKEISAVVAVQFLQVQYRFETMADLKAASYVPIAGM